MRRRTQRTQRAHTPAPDARWIKTARTGRLPLTLLNDATTTALAATSIRAIAAALHFKRPCYAQFLQRAATHIVDATTAAGYVAAHTEKPKPNITLTEVTLTEATLTEITPSESTPTESEN